MTRRVILVVLSVVVLLAGGVVLYSWKSRMDERRQRVERFRRRAFRAPAALDELLKTRHPEPVLVHLAVFAAMENREAKLAAEMEEAGGSWEPGDERAMTRLYRRLADLMPSEQADTPAAAWLELFPRTTTFGYRKDAEHKLVPHDSAHGGGGVQLGGSQEEPRITVSTGLEPVEAAAVHLDPFRIECAVKTRQEFKPPLPPALVAGTCAGGLATRADPLRCTASGPGWDNRARPMVVECLPFTARGRVIALDELGEAGLRRLGRLMRGGLLRQLEPCVDGVEDFYYPVLAHSDLSGLQGFVGQCSKLWQADLLRAEHLEATGYAGFVPLMRGPLLHWQMDWRGRFVGQEVAYADKQALVQVFTRWVDAYEARLADAD